MKPSEILIAARELLSDEKNWVKGYYAFNEFRDQREVQDNDASCFCMVGALAKASGAKTGMGPDDDSYENVSTPEVDYLVMATGNSHIPNFNDASQRTHAEVIAAFDQAIKLAQAEGN